MIVKVAGTTAYLEGTCYDRDGLPANPSSLVWWAIDLDTGEELKSPTPLSPSATFDITIPVSVNTIRNNAKASEVRRILVRATYDGLDDELTSFYDYILRNPEGD